MGIQMEEGTSKKLFELFKKKNSELLIPKGSTSLTNTEMRVRSFDALLLIDPAYVRAFEMFVHEKNFALAFVSPEGTQYTVFVCDSNMKYILTYNGLQAHVEASATSDFHKRFYMNKLFGGYNLVMFRWDPDYTCIENLVGYFTLKRLGKGGYSEVRKPNGLLEVGRLEGVSEADLVDTAEELTVDEIEERLGYKIKIIGKEN